MMTLVTTSARSSAERVTRYVVKASEFLPVHQSLHSADHGCGRRTQCDNCPLFSKFLETLEEVRNRTFFKEGDPKRRSRRFMDANSTPHKTLAPANKRNMHHSYSSELAEYCPVPGRRVSKRMSDRLQMTWLLHSRCLRRTRHTQAF